MRLKRGAEVAGIEPGLARDVARACRDDWRFPEYVAERVHLPLQEASALLERLEAEGFLERGEEKWDGALEPVWTTAVRGGALAQASFLKPITRESAEGLLAGVVERAATYNEDPGKPIWVERLVLFGSLLDEEAVDFGDVDIQLTYATRASADQNLKLAYAKASGRSFSTFMDELLWADTELYRILKNRSPYVSLTSEDISQFTDRWQAAYERISAD